MSSKPWYENGLRFECTRCGNCCRNHGSYTYVYLMPQDVSAIARHLGMARSAFLEAYCQREDGWVSLRMDAPACPFLGPGNACAIYPVRPKQCATWPFWKENLEKAVWENEVKADCPGIDRGELHPPVEIERIARENAQWYAET
jgi:Fe-S-cluster containining protein